MRHYPQPVIARGVIEAFLHKQVQSVQWIKHASRAELDEQIQQLPGPANTLFHTSPYLHQLICFYLAITHPQFAFFLDMGTGKSKIMLDAMRYLIQVGAVKRVLILVPWITNLFSWEDQCQLHAPDLAYHVMEGSTEERWEMIQTSSAQLFILNCDGLAYMGSSLTQQTRKKRARTPDANKIQKLAQEFDAIIIDESTSVKTPGTLITSVVTKLAKQIPYRYLLTGTPFGHSPIDLWSQLFILDQGKTLGSSLGLYRHAFFKESFNGFAMDYTFNKKLSSLLSYKLSGISLQYKIEECLDMPTKSYKTVKFSLEEEERRYYELVRTGFSDECQKGNKQQIKSHFMSLRQISSGFLYHTDESGVRQTMSFTPSGKAQALLHTLSEIDEQYKVVIFHFFVKSGQVIAEALSKAKIPFASIQRSTTKRDVLLKQFYSDSKTRVLVVNETIGSLGLNLQAANYLIFFESPLDPIRRTQAEARIYRSGQHHPVTIVDLVGRGTKDERIALSAREGRNLLDDILSGLVKFDEVST